ncbi:MAG: hypothetical protein ACXU9C_25565, partial [Xanthobacteraceae bacterium]
TMQSIRGRLLASYADQRPMPRDERDARISASYLLATFRRKIEALGCCRRIAQGMENCKVGQI